MTKTESLHERGARAALLAVVILALALNAIPALSGELRPAYPSADYPVSLTYTFEADPRTRDEVYGAAEELKRLLPALGCSAPVVGVAWTEGFIYGWNLELSVFADCPALLRQITVGGGWIALVMAVASPAGRNRILVSAPLYERKVETRELHVSWWRASAPANRFSRSDLLLDEIQTRDRKEFASAAARMLRGARQ
jgi:hypothetical protein